MSTNTKRTSGRIASLAAKTLQSGTSSHAAKRLAASALSQSGTSRQTGASMEKTASQVLQSNKYSDTSKKLAASILSQSNKGR
jgi:hypothetical protein